MCAKPSTDPRALSSRSSIHLQPFPALHFQQFSLLAQFTKKWVRFVSFKSEQITHSPIILIVWCYEPMWKGQFYFRYWKIKQLILLYQLDLQNYRFPEIANLFSNWSLCDEVRKACMSVSFEYVFCVWRVLAESDSLEQVELQTLLCLFR